MLYTDGLVERRSESIDAGLERLRATALLLCDHRPARFIAELADRLMPTADQRDDIAILCIDLRPEH